MTSGELYQDTVLKTKPINERLAKKLEYLWPYHIKHSHITKTDIQPIKEENLTVNGKTQQEYFEEMPKFESFESPRAYYIAQAKYRLEVYKNATDTQEYQEDYERLAQKLMRFADKAQSLRAADIRIGSETFARDLVNLCAIHNIPFIDSSRYPSEVYKVSLKRAITEIELQDTKEESQHKR